MISTDHTKNTIIHAMCVEIANKAIELAELTGLMVFDAENAEDYYFFDWEEYEIDFYRLQTKLSYLEDINYGKLKLNPPPTVKITDSENR